MTAETACAPCGPAPEDIDQTFDDAAVQGDHERNSSGSPATISFTSPCAINVRCSGFTPRSVPAEPFDDRPSDDDGRL